jgi:hypothetical protein
MGRVLSRVRVSTTVINCGFWILSRFIWILTVTTTVIHFTDLHHTNFTVESSVWRLFRSALNCFDPALSVSSVSHLLKRILCGPEREHLLEWFSLSVHKNTSVDSQRLTIGCLSMRCRVNVFNCHLDNDTGNLVTEPLSRNGRQLRFRYNPAFSGSDPIFLHHWVCLHHLCVCRAFHLTLISKITLCWSIYFQESCDMNCGNLFFWYFLLTCKFPVPVTLGKQ